MKVGGYELLSELGRGGMAVVYRARSPEGREVALKLLGRSARATQAARFARETRLQASLAEADGFVPLLDAGDAPEGAFLVMPLVPGGTLRARLARGLLPPDEVAALGVALGRALGRAHARGIVHRDVKPENVLYAADGRPLLSDLGIARHFRKDEPGARDSVSLTRTGAFAGTAGYAAFEQFVDSRTVSAPADVFALGCVLYEALAGVSPFAGATPMEVVHKLEQGRFEPLRALRPETPAGLADAIERAIARDPEDRFPDGDALARALEAPARPASPRRRLLPLVVAAAAVLVAGGAAVLFRGRASLPGPPPAPPAGTTPRDEARALVARSLERSRVDDDEGAIALASRAIALDPGLAEAWCARGGALRCRHEDDKAIRDLERAITLDPGLAEAWRHLGAARRHKGDHAGAVRDLTLAIALEPRSGAAWTKRGEARKKLGDLPGALADLDQGLALDPDNASALRARALARKGSGDRTGALADFERSLALSPDDPDAPGTRLEVQALRGLK